MLAEISEYRIKTNTAAFRLALVADLHNENHSEVLEAMAGRRPDFIAAAGDITERLDGGEGARIAAQNERGFEFLRRAAEIAPVFYAPGNHEGRVSPENAARIAETGAVLLENSWTRFGDIAVGGLLCGSGDGWSRNVRRTPEPDLKWLAEFAALPGYRILLSHHPEYYPRYIRATGIELTLSGHAHGGQWRLFGRGLFAPGQGVFPKYTSGVYENRLVVSRGLANNAGIPRLFNPEEVVFVTAERE